MFFSLLIFHFNWDKEMNHERSIYSLIADDIKPWMIWGYYVSPMMYGQNAIAINEFLDERWSTVRLS